MVEILHQFSNESFYKPNWKINYLFLGTFNPITGENVKYFYGRNKNKTWKILSDIFNEDFNTENKNFLELIKRNGIACMDLIHSVKVPNEKINEVNGKGYADSKIINKKVSRLYNTTDIIKIINDNPNVKIYSTWGNGSKLKEWKDEIVKIPNIKKLVSPSMAARVPKGIEKYNYMLNNWISQIKS